MFVPTSSPDLTHRMHTLGINARLLGYLRASIRGTKTAKTYGETHTHTHTHREIEREREKIALLPPASFGFPALALPLVKPYLPFVLSIAPPAGHPRILIA